MTDYQKQFIDEFSKLDEEENRLGENGIPIVDNCIETLSELGTSFDELSDLVVELIADDVADKRKQTIKGLFERMARTDQPVNERASTIRLLVGHLKKHEISCTGLSEALMTNLGYIDPDDELNQAYEKIRDLQEVIAQWEGLATQTLEENTALVGKIDYLKKELQNFRNQEVDKVLNDIEEGLSLSSLLAAVDAVKEKVEGLNAAVQNTPNTDNREVSYKERLSELIEASTSTFGITAAIKLAFWAFTNNYAASSSLKAIEAAETLLSRQGQDLAELRDLRGIIDSLSDTFYQIGETVNEADREDLQKRSDDLTRREKNFNRRKGMFKREKTDRLDRLRGINREIEELIQRQHNEEDYCADLRAQVKSEESNLNKLRGSKDAILDAAIERLTAQEIERLLSENAEVSKHSDELSARVDELKRKGRQFAKELEDTTEEEESLRRRNIEVNSARSDLDKKQQEQLERKERLENQKTTLDNIEKDHQSRNDVSLRFTIKDLSQARVSGLSALLLDCDSFNVRISIGTVSTKQSKSYSLFRSSFTLAAGKNTPTAVTISLTGQPSDIQSFLNDRFTPWAQANASGGILSKLFNKDAAYIAKYLTITPDCTENGNRTGRTKKRELPTHLNYLRDLDVHIFRDVLETSYDSI